MNRRTKGVLAIMVVAAMALVAAGCSGDSGGGGLTLAGRGLTVNVSDAQKVDSLTYQDVDNRYYRVGPIQPGHELVVAKVTIWNTRSGRLSLLVGGEAAVLRGRDRETIPALDPYERRESLASVPPDLGRYLPFLWGPADLPQGFNISGWMAFEVPEGVDIRGLEWDQVDSLTFPVSVK